METGLIKITELSRHLGISSRALRYYEQVGLIESVRLEDKKYRFYAPEAIDRLRQILILRKMQIPIRDILCIYRSHDMSVLVETFVNRIQAIDAEVTALSELKRIINEFLQTMMRNGITQISALPLLYEQMDKQLQIVEDMGEHGTLSYEHLSDVSERLEKPLDIRIIDLAPMRVLSSTLRESGASDVEGFWDWLSPKSVPVAMPGRCALFEYQNDFMQTVVIHKVNDDFLNDGPYADFAFPGGLFAACGTYLDNDLDQACRGMIRFFDDNAYYEVDYVHGGHMRHAPLLETVLSPDEQRERVDLFVPVKKRLPNAALYDPGRRACDISVRDVDRANPALWEMDVPMNGFTPILHPFYHVNEAGEAEYIASVDKRRLSTEVSVRIPFRVDIQFKVDQKSGTFANGSDEGSIRFYHGNHMFGINMENNADSRLSKESVCFHQPVFGDYHSYPGLGRIAPGEYNRLSWIVGERYFAVIINGEMRYCGIDFPYMTIDPRMLPTYPIMIGSNGKGKKYIRAVRVSQLKQSPKIKLKEGALHMIMRQSNNRIPNIHQLITMHYGENYWFNGCGKYVMECLGEADYDYWFFSGLTGDNLAQVYSRDHFRGDGASDYQVGGPEKGKFIERVFDKCGYASTFVKQEDLKANREMYLRTLMAYIDKGIPVIRYFYGWGVFVGYEDYGKTLMYLTADKTEPERVPQEALFASAKHPSEEADGQPQDKGFGWVFVGEKTKQMALGQIYRDVVRDMPRLLTTDAGGYCFGGAAFRAWADEIEGGRYDGMKPEEFDAWWVYTIYVCNMATNGSCRAFLERALQLNPDLTFLEDVIVQYKKLAALWNGSDGQMQYPGENLESLGGGFNVTLDVLQDVRRRKAIADKIREGADCMDRVLALLEKHLPSA